MIYANDVCEFYLKMWHEMERGVQSRAIKAGLLCAVALKGGVIQNQSYPLEEVYKWYKDMVTLPAEVLSGATYKTTVVSSEAMEDWSRKLLKEIEHMFEEGVMFNYPATSLIDILRKSGFCTIEFFTAVKDYMYRRNQPIEYVKSVLTYVPTSSTSGIRFYVESASYKKPMKVTGCVPYETPLLVEGFGDVDFNAMSTLSKRFKGESEASCNPFRWLIAMRESLDGSTSDGWTYALMAGLKTILSMCGVKDLHSNDIFTLFRECRGQQIKYPRDAYIYIPEDVRNLVMQVTDGGNVTMGNRRTLWCWLEKLYKQLLS